MRAGGITAYQPPNRDHPPRPRSLRAVALQLWLWQRPRVHTPPPNLRGILIISKTLPVPVSTPLPFSPSHESLPFGEHQSAKCRNLGQRHSLETCSGWWPRQLSRPDPPHGVTGRISRRSGLRGSRGPWARPARALSAEAGERLEGREDGWMFVHGMDGRAVQQAGSVFTVQWLPSGGGPLCGPQRSPGRCRKGGRAGPDLVFALAPRARQVLRAPAEDAWASGAQQAFSCHRLGCTPFRETRPPPARPANRTPLSLGQVPSCWDPSLVGIHPL